MRRKRRGSSGGQPPGAQPLLKTSLPIHLFNRVGSTDQSPARDLRFLETVLRLDLGTMATAGLRVVYDSVNDHPSKKPAEI